MPNVNEWNGIKYYYHRNRNNTVSVYVKCPKCGKYGRLNLASVTRSIIHGFRIVHSSKPFTCCYFTCSNPWFNTLLNIYTEWKGIYGKSNGNSTESRLIAPMSYSVRKVVKIIEKLRSYRIKRISLEDLIKEARKVGIDNEAVVLHAVAVAKCQVKIL